MTWEQLQPTADDTVRIEARSPGYVRYQANDGRRWEVRGYCDHRGFCMVGANVMVNGEPVQIQSVEHLQRLIQVGAAVLNSEMDVPVGPGFSGCCPLTVTELAT